MSPIFHNAWNATFTERPKWLYCMWHMKKAVRRQLYAKEKNEDIRNAIEKKLEKLTKISKEDQFLSKLKSFENYCRRKSMTFFEYFKKYYSSTYERWALHARLDCDLNTNMFVEAYFGEFKRTYLLYKSKNRLDFVFKAILIYDKHIRLANSRRSKSNQKQFMGYRQIKALEKHNMAKKLRIKDYKFNREQMTVTNKNYAISLGSCRDCEINCSILCRDCHICMHRYKCSCLSFQSRKELCKHIHVAHTMFTKSSQNVNSRNQNKRQKLTHNEETHKTTRSQLETTKNIQRKEETKYNR